PRPPLLPSFPTRRSSDLATVDLTNADQTIGDSVNVSGFANVDASALGPAQGVSITGSASANSITGGAGNDVIDGGGGADVINARSEEHTSELQSPDHLVC